MTQAFRTDSIVKVDGERVRVIATDFSAPCEVPQWGHSVSNPDDSVWFFPSQVTEVISF